MKKLTFSFDLKKVWQMLLLAVLFVPCQKLMAQDADYLCFTAEEDEAYFQLYKYGTPTNVTLEYSTNGGASWTDYTFTVAEVSTYGPVIWLQNAGDKVYFRNKSNSVTNFSTSAENYYRFSIRNKKISVSGNVMSLVDKRCATTTIPNNYCFARLFDYCPSITSAPKLPATELKEGCYYRMFTGCNNLTNAPTLPARTLKSYCYYEMFESCTSLSHVEVGFAEWVPSGTTDALRWWMQDVSQTGTFECPKDLDTSSRSNYIPDGWTISQYMPDYLCFTTEKDASICLEKQGSPTEVTIEYSKDGMKWNTLTLDKYVEFQSGETLYLRNASETVTEFSKGGRDYYHFRLSSSGRISASGNIMSLVDKSCNTKTIPCNYCFYELFSGNRNLTSAPKLPATTLAIECYENMFEDCTGLTEAPELPATTLVRGCYENMFSGCTGLVNAPELAATTLAEGCYRSMFQGCTGLTVAPELPATTLVRGCYENMFGDCTGLTEAPELPAPTLVEKCYYGMFDNCSNLRKVSVSFKEWFKLDENGATAGWLGDVAEEGEFICPPGLPNLTGSSSYIPENWTVKHPYLCFTANTTSSSRVSLSKVGSPADVALEYSKDASVWQPYTFGREISLSPGASVYFRNPSRTPIGFSTSSANYYHFSVEGDVAASGNIMTLVEKTGSITEMPDDYISLFYGLFSGCTGLTAAPELPATKLARKCYMEMFSGCTNLVSAPELPATTLANYCYNGMFSGCTSLTSAPVLPVTTLANYCYREMFKDCSSLNYIKVGFTQWHENATRDWVSGVAAKGAFDSPVELDKTKTGTSNIPAGWAQALYHPKSEPTSRTVGYSQDCWEVPGTGKYYSDNLCTQELTKVRLLRYAKLRSNPITYLEEGGSSAENKTYEGVPFNWVAGGPFDPGATSVVGTKRHVEFTVIGTDVADARLKLYLSVAFTTRYYIRIFVNGTEKHKKLYDNTDDENFVGYKPKAYIDAYPLEGLKTGDVVCLEVEKNYEGIIGHSYYDACIEYTSFDASEIFEPVHHDAKQATYRTVGNIDHWEGKGPNNSRYYSDEAFTEELSPAQVFTYEKLISNPVTANNGFTIKEDVTYDGVQFNWAAETYYSSNRHTNIKSTVEFTVFGTDVENARVKWWKNLGDIKYARYTVNIYVNGTRAYSVNQFDGKFLGGFFAVPLQGLKAGDRVTFEVYGDISEAFGLTIVYIAACLEYTSSNGGKGNVIVKAADAQKYMGETDPELTYTTYPANIELSGINLTRDEGEEAGEYAIRMSEGEGANPDYDITFAEGKFTISKSPITITADDKTKLAGDADPELTWSVKGKLIEGHDLTDIIISREKGEEAGTYSIYASQANGANPYYDITFVDGTLVIADTDLPIYHGAAEPTYRTLGYTQNCWEDPATGKIYSDVECTQELSSAETVTYKKLISSPVTANSGFTLKDVEYNGVQFNWAAETSYKTTSVQYSEKGTRSVEFTVYGTDVDNARVKWNKDNGACQYGKFTITVYVNGTQVYSINQDDNKSLSGLFAVPLQGLKTGDVVKFEVQKPMRSDWVGSVTIAACLEYTSSNGGLNGMLITANQDPDHTENYYSTFWSSTAAYQVPEGVTAYTGKVEDSTSEPNTSVLKLTAIEDGIIPASQGVILKLTTNDNTETQKQFVITLTTKAGTWSGTNALTGTDEATTLGENDYALSLGQHGVGFYLWEGKSIGAHKAYLTLPSSFGAKAFIFQFDNGETTGILKPVMDEKNDGPAYNLNGMRVNDGYKGIVIKNGKKIYQK